MAVLSHLGPTRQDTAAVGAILVGSVRVIGAAMMVPMVVALALDEWNAAAALAIGGAATVVVTAPLVRIFPPVARPTWSQAFVATGMAWPVAAAAAVPPLLLSGHYVDALHAFADAMAGLTTTGATFAGDLDHLPVGTNLWRHALHPIGAVGALLVVATIRLRGQTFVATGNVAQAGEQRILPRRGRSLRYAIRIVVGWSVLGTVVLTVVALFAGVSPARALLHGITLATSAVSTGGFSLTTASARALHSTTAQVVLAVLMLAGATSLLVHRATAARRLSGLREELDLRMFAVTGAALTAVAMLGLARYGVHDDPVSLARQGLFMVIAAHTTTGLTVVPPQLISTDWGDLAPAALVTAMGIGGMAGSIAGGVSTLRVGLILKGIVREVRRLLLPEAAVVIETYQQGRRHRLNDRHVRASATVLLLLVAGVFGGSVVFLSSTAEGDLPQAMFAAMSAVSTTGLSLGFVGAASSSTSVVTTTILMWFGRVEFLAALAAIGLVARWLPGVGGRR